MAALALAALVAGCGDKEAGTDTARGPGGTMILATTTSTRDTGLLDELVPRFEQASNCRVKTVAVGSGQALALGARGDADALLVHSPAAEQAFMRDGHGASRRPVMANDFVIAGPPGDPAGIAETASAPAAMERIAESEATFASRADDSGTHAKEHSLWEAAGIAPEGDWYVETGQGMGETLTIASQKDAYLLSDRSTFLAARNLELDVLSQGDRALLNPYHVIVVAGEGGNRGCAEGFARWLRSPMIQRAIGTYGRNRFGQPLFQPTA